MPELSHASAATVIIACIVAAAAAFFVGVAVTVLIRRLAARRGIHVERRSIWRAPLALLLVVLAVRGVLLGAGTQRERVHPVGYILNLAAIAIVGWLLTVVAVGVERTLLGHYPDAGLEDRRSRHVRTKIILVTRVTQAVIVAITVAAMLWTIPPLRDISVGIFASAGVIGLVVGLAAQTTLGNLFAGLQIAFTDAIRIDDIVVIEAQRARIEAITLTYVAARMQDNTTMILPCTYFTTTPFQNWTHKGAQIRGIVEITVASSASLDSLLEALRAELGRILESSAYWGRQQGDLHVEDAIGPTVKLIAVVTAVDGDAVEPLRREVREGLLTFLQRNYPEALPGGQARRPSP
jgi:small-conductance mechanosensitive channel